MLFKEIIAVCFKNLAEHVNTLNGYNTACKRLQLVKYEVTTGL